MSDTPPHHADAEAALISSCLTSTVTPDDLYTPANRRVYAAILRLHTRGEPIDPITVAHEVQGLQSSVRSGGRTT